MVFTYINHTIQPQNIEELYELDSSYEPIVRFVRNWLSGDDTFQFRTSGSTGAPGMVEIKRSQIQASVNATASFLKLQKSDQILLCLAPNYVASIMMAARGLILDLDVHVVKPSADPLAGLNQQRIDFASFVPYQIYHIIEAGRLEELGKIKNVLIGGAPISDEAFRQISSLPNASYMTYGMTETVTHIALMRITGEPGEATYHTLPNLAVGVNEHDCLWVKGAVSRDRTIQTNDVVSFSDEGRFRWMGRRDFMINSGGVKIHPEQVERVIEVMFKALNLTNEFYLFGAPDELLGQKLILAVEGPEPINCLLDKINPAIKSQFGKYHQPKDVRYVTGFERTASGKVKRINPDKLISA